MYCIRLSISDVTADYTKPYVPTAGLLLTTDGHGLDAGRAGGDENGSAPGEVRLGHAALGVAAQRRLGLRAPPLRRFRSLLQLHVTRERDTPRQRQAHLQTPAHCSSSDTPTKAFSTAYTRTQNPRLPKSACARMYLTTFSCKPLVDRVASCTGRRSTDHQSADRLDQ